MNNHPGPKPSCSLYIDDANLTTQLQDPRHTPKGLCYDIGQLLDCLGGVNDDILIMDAVSDVVVAYLDVFSFIAIHWVPIERYVGLVVHPERSQNFFSDVASEQTWIVFLPMRPMGPWTVHRQT